MGVFKCGVVLRTDVVAPRVQGAIQTSSRPAHKLEVNCLYRPRRLCMQDILVLKGSEGHERSFPLASSSSSSYFVFIFYFYTYSPLTRTDDETEMEWKRS